MKSTNKTIRKTLRQSGFTFLEFMSVLALIVIGAVVVLNVVGSGRQTSLVDRETKALSAAKTRIAAIYAGRPNYASISTTNLINAQAFPANTISGTTVSNVWGGTLAVAAANVGSGTNNGYTLTYTNVPQAGCNDFVSANDAAAVISTVNGVTTKALGAALDLTTLSGATACGAGDANTVVLTAIN